MQYALIKASVVYKFIIPVPDELYNKPTSEIAELAKSINFEQDSTYIGTEFKVESISLPYQPGDEMFYEGYTILDVPGYKPAQNWYDMKPQTGVE